jgi:alkylhydroperoxidase/carboxymuconolactone decarboxylase family protein YurZ
MAIPESIVGFAPFAIVITAGVIVGILYIAGRVPKDFIPDVAEAIIIIGLGITVIVIIVNLFCLNIRPYERFDGGSDLLTGIAQAEKDVCGLMTRADGFIQSDVGPPGQDNPSLVTTAQVNARAAAGGPVVDCSAGLIDASGDAMLQEAENRIARLETTLNGFTAPIFQKAYKASNTCENFADDPAVRLDDLQKRLATIQSLIAQQKQNYLKPIDDKNAAMQRGELSDCDRRKGGAVGGGLASRSS